MSSFVRARKTKDTDHVVALRLPRTPRGIPQPKETKLKVVASSLYWASSTKRPEDAKVQLDQVVRIVEGQSTKGFNRFKSLLGRAKDRSLSIVYTHENVEHTLDLVLSTEESYQAFKALLTAEIDKAHQRFADPDVKYLVMMWAKADTNLDGTLSKAEISQLLSTLNINLSSRFVGKMFKEVDKNHDKTLNFEEFLVLMAKLRQRPELQVMWSSMVNNNWEAITPTPGVAPSIDASAAAADQSKVLTLQGFHTFVTQVQGEDMTLEQARALMLQHDPDGRGASMSYQRFVSYMSSATNDALSPEKAVVYQDMTQPLSDYFIASSHNTYLEADQLNGPSSVNRYISDLLSGCRCVELDCWDGSDGEPIVYHGHTLTGRILFKDIIQAVNKYAFQVSPFPVILSLENHCCISQQQKMAEYMKSILGDKIAMPKEDTIVASPWELMNKIVIKAKRLSKAAETLDDTSTPNLPDGDLEDDLDDDEDVDLPKAAKSPTSASPPASPSKSPSQSLSKMFSSKKVKKPKVADELSEITWMSGQKFKGWDKDYATDGCISYGEPKMEKYLAKHPQEWIELNKRMFTRIYPGGLRVDSSNYMPVGPWTVGCQIVALNYQTPGLPMQLNKGKFLENGGCGYVLKPEYMREKGVASTFHPQSGPWRNPVQITLTIVSAQQLPKPGGARKGEIIDPYVKVEVFGVPADRWSETTHHINDNGFNPCWATTYTLQVRAPELALLNLAVWDKDSGLDDDYIASSALPVSCLRNGYRRVQLYSFAGAKTGDYEHASLLVYIHTQPAAL